jgi:hypothetical protein
LIGNLAWVGTRLQIDFYTAYRGSGQDGASRARLSPSLGFVWQTVEHRGLSLRYSPEWFFTDGAVFYSGAQEGRVSGWFDVFPPVFSRVFNPPRPDLAAIAEVKEPADVFGAERISIASMLGPRACRRESNKV